MLDTDLAEIYGYTTRAFNQQVRNNSEKFGPDFMFELTQDEQGFLRSNMQIEETELYRPIFDKLLKNPPMTIKDTETHMVFQRHLFGGAFLFTIFKKVSVVWQTLVLKELQLK